MTSPGEHPAPGSNGRSTSRPGLGQRRGQAGMVTRTTPSPPQGPGPSCQAGLTVLPGPELRPPLLRRGSHTGMPPCHPCLPGPLPSTDAPGPVASTPGARRVWPLLCPAGLWADGRPTGPAACACRL